MKKIEILKYFLLLAWTIVKKPSDFFIVMNFGNFFKKIIEVAIKNFQNFETMQIFRHKKKAAM